MDNFLTFNNIEEIKFTKIHDNVFSISIKSDIELNGKDIKDTVFKAQLCKIDPTLELKFGREYTDVSIGNEYIIKSESLSIPINVQLLFDRELNEFFSINKTK